LFAWRLVVLIVVVPVYVLAAFRRERTNCHQPVGSLVLGDV